MKAKVSVIVAVHNGAEKLKDTLDSIKNQSLKDIEVIMADAASSDGTAEIMKSYCGDSRFEYIRLENDSISGARNHCIGVAKGKYIAFGDVNVIFTKNLIEGMYLCAEKDNADLCVAPMASSDLYGKHEFTSTDILSRRKKTDKFDTDLIWNPAVTNKLFLKEKIKKFGIEFRRYGKAREAAFSIPFAFESNTVVCSSKGAAVYVVPVSNEGVSAFDIEHYLDAYEYIISQAKVAFEREIQKSTTDFDRKELKKLMVCYIDQVYHKELTVLLYSYYRHFWSLEQVQIKKYADIIMTLFSGLSKSGQRSLKKKNKDIFYDDGLIYSKSEMAKRAKVTVCIGKSESRNHEKENFEMLISSVYKQTMPSFELFVDSRLKDIFPKSYLSMENLTFIEASSLGEFKDLALEKSNTDYIMYQDGFSMLNPKILMRHYGVLEGKDKYGFSISPLTSFNGKQTGTYAFSELFFSDMKQTRVSPDDSFFALDLFFCNKLFRKEHLNGIHFSFSDNPVQDMYKLYLNSRFKKISHRGVYLPYSEERAISYLKTYQQGLSASCKKVIHRYKTYYFGKVTFKKAAAKVKVVFEKISKLLMTRINLILNFVFSNLKLKNKVLFYSTRADYPLENLQALYEDCNCNKTLFCISRPLGTVARIKARYLLLTSKVIVTDDSIDFLRKLRLKKEQTLIQIWYTGGAFRRFGLDDRTVSSRINEYKTHSQYNYVCVSSEYVRQFFAHAMGVDMDVIVATGTPRTDEIIRDENIGKNRQEICTKHPLLKDKKVYVYFPTFRQLDGVSVPFDPKIDWDKLNDELDDDEVFIVSRHPFMKEEYIKGRFYSRVKDYTPDPSAELIAVADVVITDYSSIVFDASLMGKPMVFYAPDYDSFKDDFYLNYERDLPGEIITDSSLLLEALRRAKEISSPERIELFKEREMGSCDGKASKRINEIIEKSL